MHYFKTLLLVIFSSAQFYCFGQLALKGKIIDSISEKSIAGASVFISNTSIGTITNDSGEFEIQRLLSGEFDLVISVIGYEPYVQHISGTSINPLLIKLHLKTNELQDVVVSTYEKDGWSKWSNFFLASFIGSSSYANDCTIKNYKVIRFKYSRINNFISADATEPLIIENKALGYILKYDMTHFSYDFNSRNLLYSGHPLFIEMEGNYRRMRKWKQNRQEAYVGSMMHFMRAIYRNKVDEAGFQLRRLEKKPNPEKERVRELYQHNTRLSRDANISRDSIAYYKKVMQEKDIIEILHPEPVPADSIAYAVDSLTAGMNFKDYLLVTFPSRQEQPGYYADTLSDKRDPYITSAICLINHLPVNIQSNGSFNNPIDLISTGYWAWSEKIATLLPFDYKPEEYIDNKNLSIKGKLVF